MVRQEPEDFCVRAQRLVTGTSLPVTNGVNPDRQAFIRSKPTVQPLVTQEFHSGDAGSVTMISCKLVTARNLRTVYGEKAAAGDRDCRTVNADTLEALGGPGAAGRLSVVLEPDLVAPLGPAWLATPQRIWQEDGRLHIQASAVYAELGDPALRSAPPSVWGTRNCHLVHPAYLAALLEGRIEPP